MANSFRVDIVTPEKVLYAGDAVSLIVPSQEGYMGVLAGHAPLVALLGKGKITIRDASKAEKEFQCEGKGLIEVLNNRASVLLDSTTSDK